MKRLVVASSNAKKRKEIEAMLAAVGIELLPASATAFVYIEEDANSFAGNARKKAEAFAKANKLPALADDSGLCVDALKGAPGIYSARFAGEHASDADNNHKLLDMLAGETHREASFMCTLHLALPEDDVYLRAEGSVQGHILEQAVGDTGFGYDPLFYCPELGKAFAMASPDEKASVSHRGRALQKLVKQLEGWL